jgi:hypothetical protein
MAEVQLLIVDGPNAGREFDITGAVVIGRDTSAGIVIDDPEASRRHASLSAEGASIRVEDLGSTNGTFVGGERLSEARVLVDGERLRIGTTVFQVRSLAQATKLGTAIPEEPVEDQATRLGTAIPEDLPPEPGGPPTEVQQPVEPATPTPPTPEPVADVDRPTTPGMPTPPPPEAAPTHEPVAGVDRATTPGTPTPEPPPAAGGPPPPPVFPPAGGPPPGAPPPPGGGAPPPGGPPPGAPPPGFPPPGAGPAGPPPAAAPGYAPGGPPVPFGGGGIAAGAYPIEYEADYPSQGIARWFPFVAWLLAIPQFIVLMLVGIAAYFAFIGAWFSIIFTRRYPRGIFNFIAGTLRWGARVNGYTYWFTQQYPPFSLGEDPYPVRVRFRYPEAGISRWRPFFQWILAIPHWFVLSFVGIAVYFVAIIGFFAILFTRQWPPGLWNFMVGFFRWQTRVIGYVFLMTEEYPPFGFG